IGLSLENTDAAISKNLITILGTGIILILLLGSVLYFTSIYVIKTINGLGQNMSIMAEGDFTIEMSENVLQNNDELSEIAKAVDTMKSSVGGMIHTILDKSQSLAAHSEELTATTFEAAQSADEVSSSVDEIAKGSSQQAA